MVCGSCKLLNVNILIATLIISVVGCVFTVLPEELISQNIEKYLMPIMGWILIFAIIGIAISAIYMSIREKKCEQMLIVLKDIEEDMLKAKNSKKKEKHTKK